MPLRDALSRPLRNLRVSVTDRCNLRCSYCMPEPDYVWLPHEGVLRFEETVRLVRVFAGLGVDRIRLTGGEPLLRRDLPTLVGWIAETPGIADLSLTTNATRLEEHAEALRAAGLGRLTISLDTLDRATFRTLTRRDELDRVLAGIDAAERAGFRGTKLNCVVMRGVNDHELVPLLGLGRERGLEVRFIEYMDVGGATRWSAGQVVPRGEILARIAEHLGRPEPAAAVGPAGDAAPAERFRLPDGTVFGVIASTTAPFCGSCDRSRVTADGRWFPCLYARAGLDLREPLRAGASDAALAELLRARWEGRRDRGAEERLAGADRRALAGPDELRSDPHLEMHTRGG